MLENYTPFSLDHNQDQLYQILKKAPSKIALMVGEQLLEDSGTPRAIGFDGGVVFGARARLGELQKNEKEIFVPFVVQEIM